MGSLQKTLFEKRAGKEPNMDHGKLELSIKVMNTFQQLLANTLLLDKNFHQRAKTQGTLNEQ